MTKSRRTSDLESSSSSSTSSLRAQLAAVQQQTAKQALQISERDFALATAKRELNSLCARAAATRPTLQAHQSLLAERAACNRTGRRQCRRLDPCTRPAAPRASRGRPDRLALVPRRSRPRPRPRRPGPAASRRSSRTRTRTRMRTRWLWAHPLTHRASPQLLLLLRPRRREDRDCPSLLGRSRLQLLARAPALLSRPCDSWPVLYAPRWQLLPVSNLNQTQATPWPATIVPLLFFAVPIAATIHLSSSPLSVSTYLSSYSAHRLSAPLAQSIDLCLIMIMIGL